MRMALCGAVLAAAGIATLAAYVDTSDAAAGMRFNPSATLDSSQVQDRRGQVEPWHYLNPLAYPADSPPSEYLCVWRPYEGTIRCDSR